MTLRGCLLALACFPVALGTRAVATPSLRERVTPLAEKVAAFLREAKHGTVTLGRFTAPEDSPAQVGPGLTQALADELARLGIEVKAGSAVTLRGKYAPAEGGGTLQGVRVTTRRTASRPSPSRWSGAP